MVNERKRAAVIGHPVAHSLSPVIHRYWLDTYNIAGEYMAEDVPPEKLKDYITSLATSRFSGVNVTIPHKESVLPLMDELSESARKIGAINTVSVREDKTLFGDNTDAQGFMQNLKSSVKDISPYMEKAVVLGAGGAARAIVYALKKEGVKQIVLTNRTVEKATALAQDMGENIEIGNWQNRHELLESTTLLVNTTSLGMTGKSPLELSLEYLPANALVSDIVYVPLMTDLLKDAQACGNPIVTGIGMLLHQAVPAFEAWFGIRPQVDDTLVKQIMEKAAA